MQIASKLVALHQPDHSVSQATSELADGREEMRNDPLMKNTLDVLLGLRMISPYHDCVEDHHRGIDQNFKDFVFLDNLSVTLVNFLDIFIENLVDTLLQLWRRSVLLFKMFLWIIAVLMISIVCCLRF